MTQPVPFHPSPDDVHHLIEHNPGVRAKFAHNLHTPYHFKSKVLWRGNVAAKATNAPKPDPDSAQEAIKPHFNDQI